MLGVSFELSVKVLNASKTNGMTHAEAFATAVTKSQSEVIPVAAAEACLQHSFGTAKSREQSCHWIAAATALNLALRHRQAQHGAADRGRGHGRGAAAPSELWAPASSLKDGRFVTRIRILVPDTSALLV